MRRTLAVAHVSMALGALAACAAADEAATPPREDAGPSVVTEGGPPPEDASLPEIAPIPPCSEAGWCPTDLPDVDLMVKDIWPLPGRAFAIAESPTLGVKILEWEDGAATWKYIDDNAQNQGGLGKYAGRIWAANADEVYYAVGVGTIFHGKRPATPATAWTWDKQRLEDHSPDALAHPDHDHGYWINKFIEFKYPIVGAWGVGADVYAWYANTVFRRVSEDGGPPTWIADHIATDVDTPDEHIFFVGAAGVSADDVWFVGVREGANPGCPLIVRRTAAGYERIFDGDVATWCGERMGLRTLAGWGWLLDLQALPGNRFGGIQGGHDMTLISHPDEATYSVERVPIQLGLFTSPLFSAYFTSADETWVSGMGIVVRADSVWDGGTFGVSTISLNGGPVNRPMYQIRGTSETNLWAVGVRHALHKTTR